MGAQLVQSLRSATADRQPCRMKRTHLAPYGGAAAAAERCEIVVERAERQIEHARGVDQDLDRPGAKRSRANGTVHVAVTEVHERPSRAAQRLPRVFDTGNEGVRGSIQRGLLEPGPYGDRRARAARDGGGGGGEGPPVGGGPAGAPPGPGGGPGGARP